MRKKEMEKYVRDTKKGSQKQTQIERHTDKEREGRRERGKYFECGLIKCTQSRNIILRGRQSHCHVTQI
jgi:hypothetical protein